MLSGFILGQTLPESRRCDLLCASDSATSNEVGTKEYVRTSEARAPAITCAAASLSLAPATIDAVHQQKRLEEIGADTRIHEHNRLARSHKGVGCNGC
jgi:hypothetical protein